MSSDFRRPVPAMRLSIFGLVAGFPFFTHSLPVGSDCSNSDIIAIEACLDGGSWPHAQDGVLPTVDNSHNNSESPSYCLYDASPGMWGRGNLLFFYMQAVINFLDVTFLVDHTTSRSGTALLVIPFLLAYLFGFKNSALALEAPATSSLLTLVIVPLLLQALLCWSWSEATASSFALAVISLAYLLVMTTSILSVRLWGSVPVECNAFSGLDIGSVKAPGAKSLYTFLFCLGILLAIFSLGSVAHKAWIGGRRCRVITRLWYQEDRQTFYIWLSVTTAIFAVSIGSIEMTMKKHNIVPNSLGSDMDTADQWIPLATGALVFGGTILNLGRGILSRRSVDNSQAYEMAEPAENGSPAIPNTSRPTNRHRRLVSMAPSNRNIGYETSPPDKPGRSKHNSGPTLEKSRASLSSLRGPTQVSYARGRRCTL